MAEIVIVLDESGSMGCQREKIINSLNEFCQVQKKTAAPGSVLHIIKFNDEVLPTLSMDVAKNRGFTLEDYTPGGMTAFYDAVDVAIEKFKDSTRQVVLIIVTDGEENSSKRWVGKHAKKEEFRSKLHEHITQLEKRPVNPWVVTYLSEGNLEKQGKAIGVDGCSNLSVAQGQVNTVLQSACFSSAISAATRGDKATYECAMMKMKSKSAHS